MVAEPGLSGCEAHTHVGAAIRLAAPGKRPAGDALTYAHQCGTPDREHAEFPNTLHTRALPETRASPAPLHRTCS